MTWTAAAAAVPPKLVTDDGPVIVGAGAWLVASVTIPLKQIWVEDNNVTHWTVIAATTRLFTGMVGAEAWGAAAAAVLPK